MRRLLITIVLAAGSLSLLFAEDSPDRSRIRLAESGQRKAVVEVQNLSATQRQALAAWKTDDPRWTKLLVVRVSSKEGENPALAGQVTLSGETLQFQPRYALQPGLTYSVMFHGAVLEGKEASPQTARLTVAKPDAKPNTIVEQIYPSINTLPENHLRFYVAFSSPMSLGEAYQRIHLKDADGKVIPAPFLELAEEMWAPDRRRLTLLIHPGRIKRGLRSFDEEGPVLFVGKKYSLVIDADWPDGEGVRLKESFKKEFTVTEGHNAGLDTHDWKISQPDEKTKDALRIDFPRPLDWALLERMVTVVDSDGREVSGMVAINNKETRWEFTPENAWKIGSKIRIDPALEDPCGNRIGRAFDLDITKDGPKVQSTEAVTIPISLTGGRSG